VASGFAFAVLFALTGSNLTPRMGHAIPAGLLFGLACFVAFPLPEILSSAIFVNLHRGFVVGSLLNSLLFCLASGVICALLMT
jgi:predicted cobalt transporter CbtA